MQLLDLALARGFAIIAQTCIEGACRLLEELLLPSIDLIRVNLVTLGQVSDRRLVPQRLQGDLRLQCRVDLPSRLLRHSPLLFRKERQTIQLSPWSQKLGPLQYRPRSCRLPWPNAARSRGSE